LSFTACQKVDLTTLNSDANTTVSLSVTSLVLDKDAPDAQALTVSWTQPDFGYDAAPKYKILVDFANGDFSAPQEFAVGNVYQKTFTAAELNSKLLTLGAEADAVNNLAVKVVTVLSDYKSIYSNIVNIDVTPYASILDLSSNWGVVGSGTPGGWGNPAIPDLPFWTTDTSGVLVAYVTLRDGEIKFRTDNAWTTNLGDDGNNGSLEAGGANIAVTAGSYKITLNLNDNTYTMIPFSWGIVGSGTPNGWGAPDIKLIYNSYADDFRAVCKLLDGEIKFRFNEDWAVNYGGTDGALLDGGANIPVAAGYYLVKFNLKEMKYELESLTEVWGLVGSAAPNGWNGPDALFQPDYGLAEGKFYLNGITLINGEIKVRQNNDWAVNYGDDGNDGTLELNGANKPVTAGTYNITLDMTGATPTLTLAAW